MNPSPFKSKTTPWRVQVPAGRIVGGSKKRIAKYFKTKADAQIFCRKVGKFGYVTDAKTVPVTTQTTDTAFVICYRYMLEKLGADSGLWYQAIDHFVKTRLDVIPATVREAVEKFYSDRLALVRKGQLRKTTVEQDRIRLNGFLTEFEAIKLGALTKEELNGYIHGVPNKNGRSIFKTLSVFFSWAIKNNYVKDNPVTKLDAVDYGDFGINNDFLDVGLFRRVLRIAADLEPVKPGGEVTRDFIDLLPVFVLSGFGGLRSCEAYRTTAKHESIKWSDLYFDAEIPNIEIRDEVAKTTARKGGDNRHVDFRFAIEALKAWLALVPHYDGNPYIVRWTKRKIYKLKADFEKRTGIDLPDNGLRNSFATYAFSYSGESALGQVARQMGNSEAIARRFYRRNLPAGTGKSWFDLRPF
jgi:hypothetical protein